MGIPADAVEGTTMSLHPSNQLIAPFLRKSSTNEYGRILKVMAAELLTSFAMLVAVLDGQGGMKKECKRPN